MSYWAKFGTKVALAESASKGGFPKWSPLYRGVLKMKRAIILISVLISLLAVPQFCHADDVDDVIDDLVNYRIRERKELSARTGSAEQFFPNTPGYVADVAAMAQDGDAEAFSTTYFPSKKGAAFSVRLVRSRAAKSSAKIQNEAPPNLLVSLDKVYQKASTGKVLDIHGYPGAIMNQEGQSRGLIAQLGKQIFLVVTCSDVVSDEGLIAFVSSLQLDHFKQTAGKTV